MNRAIDKFDFSKNWSEKIDGEYTFFGVLLDYWEEIAAHWNEDTSKGYLVDYNEYLLPYVEGKLLSALNREHYDDFLFNALKREKEERNRVYSESTVQHFRVLIKRVTKIADQNGVCPDCLWGTQYMLTDDVSNEELNEDELVKLPKSLNVREEYFIAEKILRDWRQKGENFGLALMFCLGTRNSEACALHFKHICPMQCDSSLFVAQIFSTVNASDGHDELGGKSKNMYRFIPVPQHLLTLIQKRREVLINGILSGEIVVPPSAISSVQDQEKVASYVDDLHIACRGDNYFSVCVAGDLSRAGAKLLSEAKANERMMAIIDQTLHTEASEKEGFKEKDPTAYLFRRNLGSHLYFLGLTDNEIQYIMGHDIENDNDERFYYRNEEKLYPIARKMGQRPIVNDIVEDVSLTLSKGACSVYDATNVTVHIPMASPDESYLVEVRQREYGTRTKIVVGEKTIPLHGSFSQIKNEDPFFETTNILPQYHEKYRKYQRRVKEESFQDSMIVPSPSSVILESDK